MFRNELYYRIKPFVPRRVRVRTRSWFAWRKREQVRDTWPILRGSERPPEDWPGWPNGKKFALVLTHDVERQVGLDKCRKLMQLEAGLGFRSSFNFIPEGEYRVEKEFRDELTRNGFEVGVHDLHHDGKLYGSRRGFAEKAKKINCYLKDWGAVGFRSGFMLHNLDWLGDLDVAYECSTFDTDPFEPQPDGVGTIFPFWIPREQPEGGSAGGYVELPYTLPQDSTVFLLLKERHPDIWFQKLDWIAKHGGMALVNVHPDYVRFEGEPATPFTYPAEHYVRLLQYVRERYGDSCWQPLAMQVAHHVRSHATSRSTSAQGNRRSPRRKQTKIWIDLDNTPHVPFFEPIIEELRARDFPVLVTARDAFQVCDLAKKKGLQCIKIGRHYGKSRIMKACGLAYRALQLAPVILREKPILGVSHGARSQLLLSNLLRLPTILIEDYEFAQFPPMMHPTWVLAPAVIPNGALRGKNGNIRKYPGIKEDVYAWRLVPDQSILKTLGITDSELVVTVRPPATEAHYHNPESETLFAAVMNRLCGTPEARVVLLPRNQRQADAIQSQCPKWFENQKTVIPKSALDGMNLIWHSDLVVSGGGTMNREAAALGTPVYSIFRGTIGAVDKQLNAEGRLVLIGSVPEVAGKIPLVRRERKAVGDVTSKLALNTIVDTIQEIADRSRHQITK